MQTKEQVTIQIVGWNSEKTLPMAVAALTKLPIGIAKICYLDNASRDNSIAIVRQNLPEAEIVALDQNFGFTGAHNIGLERCDTPYVFTHDPDLELVPEGLMRLLEVMRLNPKVGAVQGKLWRAKSKQELVIDSAGIEMTRACNGSERGAGQIDNGQFDQAIDVAATTGAGSLYRMEALRSVRYSEKEYFDTDFFAYKDDVDLSWRLRRAGWQIKYEPVGCGFHYRTLGRKGWLNWGMAPQAIYKRLQNKRTYYSLRNWIWMLVKNITFRELVARAIFIVMRGLVWFGLTLGYWPLGKAWIEAGKGLIKMWHKRKLVI